MKTSDAQLAYAELCFKDEIPPHPSDSIDLALERDRVVGVLDAWANAAEWRWWDVRPWGVHGQVRCILHDDADFYPVGHRVFLGETLDAARAAAAKAIESGEV